MLKFVQDLNVGLRLALGFAVTLLLMAGIVAIAVAGLRDTQSRLHAVTADRYPKLKMANEVGDLVKQQQIALRDLLIAATPPAAEKAKATIDGSRQRIGELFTSIESRLNHPEGREAFAKLQQRRAEFLREVDPALASIAAGDTPAASTRITGSLHASQELYLADLEAFQALLERFMNEDAAAAQAAGNRAGTTMFAALALAALLAGGFGWAVTRSITRPLDEAVRALRRVADGDLTVEVNSARRDELGALLGALGATVGSLRGVVGEVRRGVESVTTASTQIAAGNTDLSSRTEQQASALQQTAASMEQFGSTVRQSAESARTANQLASAAREAAERGGASVGAVVTTMHDISAASQKIADIIGVIDGIAFQTNILALNAAVEAARAGDQGRGFAVVAGEVRTLAQRSAQAAKEIKALIGSSVERVEAGARQVETAGSTMREIVEQVARVGTLIEEVSAATAEQSAGIGQVSGAVGEMDRATQQNAALVEESAAAAQSLAQQAQRLSQAVAAFRLQAA